MGLTRAGASLGDAGARAERLASRPPAGGGGRGGGEGRGRPQQPETLRDCVKLMVTCPAVKSTALPRVGLREKGGTAPARERVDHAQARTSGVLF